MEELIIIIKKICPEVLESDKRIVSDGVVDSVGLVEIVSEIEEKFKIDIPIDEISPENFDNVDSIWKMIEKLK